MYTQNGVSESDCSVCSGLQLSSHSFSPKRSVPNSREIILRIKHSYIPCSFCVMFAKKEREERWTKSKFSPLVFSTLRKVTGSYVSQENVKEMLFISSLYSSALVYVELLLDGPYVQVAILNLHHPYLRSTVVLLELLPCLRSYIHVSICTCHLPHRVTCTPKLKQCPYH